MNMPFCRVWTAVVGALAVLVVPSLTGAQGVSLQRRPKVGDTLVMRVEQISRLNSSRAGGNGTQAVVTEMQVFSRTVVESRNGETTVLVTTTDSATIRSSDERSRAADARTEQLLRGHRVRIQLGLEGAMTILDQGNGVASVVDVAALIPATFPVEPVALYETWVREMAVPSGASAMGATVGGRLRATFRLDSLGRGGQLAYVSVRGDLRPEARNRSAGAVIEQGSVTGSLVLDRTRGWLLSSDVTVKAQSVMPPLAGLAASGLHFEIVVTQRVKLADR
jgi:hypothetical protein